MLASSHLKSIATLICITSIVTTAAGWQFKAIAEQAFAEKDAMAAFFGSFQGFAGALSPLAQLLLTTRVLQRFGVGLRVVYFTRHTPVWIFRRSGVGQSLGRHLAQGQ